MEEETTNNIPRNVLLFGSDQFVPSRKELRAGLLSVVLQDGAIRYVKLGETEIVRRIYMALRDQNWNTIPIVYSDWKYEINSDSFRIFFRAENKQREINFAWDGTVTGDSSGNITYSMKGRSLGNFKKRVIGLCALFPIRECAGVKATVVKRSGTRLDTTFPFFISSDQPLPGFEDVNELNFRTVNGISASVTFDGDVFEMEDQRSFTDASYKMYSTWNRNSEGDDVAPGDEVSQSITIRIETDGTALESDNSHSPVEINLDANESSPLPKIGLGSSSVHDNLSARELALLKKIGISHLRGDLDLTSNDWKSRLESLASQTRALEVGLELAVFVDLDSQKELTQLMVELNILKIPVHTLLIFDKGELATKSDSVKKAQALLTDYFSHPRIGGGTDRNYFDLSFVHPAFDSESIISYAINPQVHAFDVSSISETLEGQSWTLKSAHGVYPENRVVVTPITLKPRFNPDEIVQSIHNPNDLPPEVDPRQVSLFGASWTAGSVKSLAESSTSSLTYYETVGWRGVIESAIGSKLPDKFHSQKGMVYPLYHVLSDVCEMAGGQVQFTNSNQPLVAGAISMVRGDKVRILVHNLTWEPKTTRIRGIKSTNIWIRRLNEETAESAMFHPEEFRKNSGEKRNVVEGELELSLLPFEVARIDYDLT